MFLLFVWLLAGIIFLIAVTKYNLLFVTVEEDIWVNYLPHKGGGL